jgi:hypothetical protein
MAYDYVAFPRALAEHLVASTGVAEWRSGR